MEDYVIDDSATERDDTNGTVTTTTVIIRSNDRYLHNQIAEDTINIASCSQHTDLLLHEDEKSVKPGDKFGTHKEFLQYINDNAKQWLFYYKCSDSHKPIHGYESYTYNCIYLKNSEKYKGVRKRANNLNTNCPCKIKLRQLPYEKELTVVFVCNHHDHSLSREEFQTLQQGRRLPARVKEEIMDLLALQVHVGKIKRYVQMETGLNMRPPFFHAIERSMKAKNMERQITDVRLKELTEKIAAIEETYSSDENTEDNKKQRKRTQDKLLDSPKQYSGSKKRLKTDDLKNCNLGEFIQISTMDDEILYIQPVKCETQANPWVSDQCVPVLANGTTKEGEFPGVVQLNIIETGPSSSDQNALGEYNANVSYAIQYFSNDEEEDTENKEAGGAATENYVASETMVSRDDENHIIEYVQESQSGNNVDYCSEQMTNEDVSIPNDTKQKHNEETEYLEENEEIEYIIDENVVHEDESQTENYDNGEEPECLENEEVEENVPYLSETSGISISDVGVQTLDTSDTVKSLKPVFDVYMKDGNVTGFVTDDKLIKEVNQSVNKSVQASKSDIEKHIAESVAGNVDPSEHNVIVKIGDTYVKHEYIHKYNLEQYMVQTHFPQYIQTLAKETNMDILHMLANVYREKAMFKMTTTHKGREGNTRIWFLNDTSNYTRIKKWDSNEQTQREKLGRTFKDFFLLKDKMRSLKRHNRELTKMLQKIGVAHVLPDERN